MSNVVAMRRILPVAVAIAIGMTGTAQAKQIDGTPGNDAIRGSRQADTINGLAGDDRIGASRTVGRFEWWCTHRPGSRRTRDSVGRSTRHSGVGALAGRYA